MRRFSALSALIALLALPVIAAIHDVSLVNSPFAQDIFKEVGVPHAMVVSNPTSVGGAPAALSAFCLLPLYLCNINSSFFDGPLPPSLPPPPPTGKHKTPTIGRIPPRHERLPLAAELAHQFAEQ